MRDCISSYAVRKPYFMAKDGRRKLSFTRGMCWSGIKLCAKSKKLSFTRGMGSYIQLPFKETVFYYL